MLLTALPMMVCLFWTIFLLTNYIENHSRSIKRLMVFMFVATLLYGGHYVFFNRFEPLIPTSDTFYVYANLAVFPLYLHYIESLTDDRVRLNFWRVLLVLLPFLFASAVLMTYLRMDEATTAQFIDSYLFHNSMEDLEGPAKLQAIIHTAAKVVFALQILPIFLVGNHRIKVSHLSEEVGGSIRFMLVLFATVSLFSFVANIVGRHSFTGSSMLLAIPSVAFSIFLYYLGYIGYRIEAPSHIVLVAKEKKVTSEEKEEAAPTEKASDGFESLPLREQIEHLMNVEQVYLQPNLRISDLTKRLGSNRNYIYEAVNKEMGMSFSEYVNRRRVLHSQQLMKQNPDMLLGEVAVKSGFSSSVSFYRAFKKYVGCAPKEWKPDSPSLTLE